ncbi:MAG: chorismate mutase [Alphaproteobacteria bacterium]
MPSAAPTLDELRREIDRIDAAMHDLLIQRTAVVEEVGRAKARENPAGPETRPQFFRPGREALVVRALVERHRGAFPLASLVRIWREIMTGQLRVQTEIGVAVYAPQGGGEYWDMARDHYGAGAAYVACARTHNVVAAVRSGAAGIGVLPLPQDDDGEPWWPLVATNEPNAPAIVARIPILAEAGRPGGALLLANVDPERTGADRAYVALETAGDASAASLAADLRGIGIGARPVGAAAGAGMHLFEAEEMILRGDPRLAEIEARSRGRIARALSLGGYALPVVGAAQFRETAVA